MNKVKDDDFIKFKKVYVGAEAEKVASQDNFVKKFSLSLVTEYSSLLTEFLELNQKEVTKVINDHDKKTSFFMKELLFLVNVAKVIINDEDEFEIDYVFLTKAFVQIKGSRKTNFINNINNLKTKLLPITINNLNLKNELTFNIDDLHHLADFVLTFLTDIELRSDVVKKIFNKSLNAKLDDFSTTLFNNSLSYIAKSLTWVYTSW